MSFTKDGEAAGLVLGDDGDHVGTGGGADDEGHVGGESERAGTSHLKMMMTGMMMMLMKKAFCLTASSSTS